MELQPRCPLFSARLGGGVLGGSDSSSAPCPARAAPGSGPASHHHRIRVLLPASGHPKSVIWVLGVSSRAPPADLEGLGPAEHRSPQPGVRSPPEPHPQHAKEPLGSDYFCLQQHLSLPCCFSQAAQLETSASAGLRRLRPACPQRKGLSGHVYWSLLEFTGDFLCRRCPWGADVVWLLIK